MKSALAERIQSSRQEILASWEAGVRTLPAAARASEPALLDEVPLFLDWLVERLEGPAGAPEVQRDQFGFDHALERLTQGFDVVEVVAELALLRECLLEAWEAEPSGIMPGEIRRMNAEIDHVLAVVAMHYARCAKVPAEAGEAAADARAEPREAATGTR